MGAIAELEAGLAIALEVGNIDDIGRVYGLQEEDSGALQAGGEILSRRDRRRPELKAPSKPRT